MVHGWNTYDIILYFPHVFKELKTPGVGTPNSFCLDHEQVSVFPQIFKGRVWFWLGCPGLMFRVFTLVMENHAGESRDPSRHRAASVCLLKPQVYHSHCWWPSKGWHLCHLFLCENVEEGREGTSCCGLQSFTMERALLLISPTAGMFFTRSPTGDESGLAVTAQWQVLVASWHSIFCKRAREVLNFYQTQVLRLSLPAFSFWSNISRLELLCDCPLKV